MTFRARWTLRQAEAARLSDILAEWSSTDMTEQADGRWEVTAYFEEAPDPDFLSNIGRQFLGGKQEPVIDELGDEDWVAKSLTALSPVHVDRYFVHGSHDRDKRPANAIAIEIDAATAFGTGHHGTTAGCLAALSDLAKRRRIRNALDLGTGSGVLAFAIARTWHVPVIATDIDPVAVAIARDNARLNRVAGYVDLIEATGMRHRRLQTARAFDLVVANILAGPLAGIATELARSVAPGGTVILSGLLPGQKRWVFGTYRNRGLVLRRASVRDGWLTLTLSKPGR